MSWLSLGLAGLFEIGWALAMKQSEGLTRPLPTMLMIVGMGASFGLLALAMRSLPLSVAYSIWTGIGAVGTVVVGVAFLGETLTPARACAVALITLGIFMMKLTAS